MEANVRAIQTRAADSPALARFGEVGRILTGRDNAKASDAVAWIQETCDFFRLPGLCKYGLREDDLPEAVAKAGKASSMKGNPIELRDDELAEILRQAID